MAGLPVRVLAGGTVAVAASTAALPWIDGYGTILYLNVVLSGYAMVAAITSEKYADMHHGPVWLAILLVNLSAFLVPALVMFYSTRRRWPKGSAVGLCAWTFLYLLCLFVLFPATDGP